MRRSSLHVALLTLGALLPGCAGDPSDRQQQAARNDAPGARSPASNVPVEPTTSLPPEPVVGAGAKSISGSVLGADDRAVDVLIGFEVKDATGRGLQLDGRPATKGGYVTTQRINQDLDAAGSEDLDQWDTEWSIQLPSNAATLFVEAYPRDAGQYGKTNDIRYGRARRQIVVRGSLEDVVLRLPLRCSQGGTTGTIVGTTKVAGKPRQVTRVSAFSIGAGNNDADPILGFNVGTSNPDGTFRIGSLAGGTRYRVFAVPAPGKPQKTMDVSVTACRETRVNFSF